MSAYEVRPAETDLDASSPPHRLGVICRSALLRALGALGQSIEPRMLSLIMPVSHACIFVTVPRTPWSGAWSSSICVRGDAASLHLSLCSRQLRVLGCK